MQSFTDIFLHVNIKLPLQSLTLGQKLQRIDYMGSFTLVWAVSTLLLGINLKTIEELEWEDPKVWGLLAASAVGWVAFGVTEVWWSKEPVMPMRILGSRTPLSVALVNFFSSMGAFSMVC